MATSELTRDTLRQAALAYVARRETTRAHLRKVLQRRVQSHVRRNAAELPEADVWIDEVLDVLQEQHLLDDQRYAALRADTMGRSGRSRRAIEAVLRSKGVSAQTVQESLAARADAEPDAEWLSIQRYARRRSLGPFRRGEDDPATRAREHRSLQRAGFEHALIQRLLTAGERH